MSVINKMLQDLDRRQALGAGGESSVVRVPNTKTSGHEWFWRILVVLLTAALAWMGWVAVQLLPRKPLVTELAFQAAAEARGRTAAKPVAPAPAPAAPAVVTEEPKPVAEEPKPPPPAPATPVVSEALRLALTLETPLRPEAPKAAVAPKKDKAAPVQPVAAKPPSVDKRERTRTANDAAELHFRRAALLLNHGRVSEAEEQLIAALRIDPAHTAARQAYVALLLEHRRVDVAQRLLQDALAIDPAQPTFALTLARIYTGQREYGAALEALDRAGASGAGNADFQAMRGAVLQRIGRHSEAVEAYSTALRGGTQPATSWIGLGISLESLGRRGEAVTAYRRALAAGPIAPEAREYAESRARALE